MNLFRKKSKKLYLAVLVLVTSTLQANRKILILLGAPGAGKGTLTEQCCKKFNFTVLSTGNLCRQEIASGSTLGKEIAYYSMTTGLVHDDIIAEMVETWLKKQPGDEPIILDGYPRTEAQAKRLLNFLGNKMSDCPLDVFYLESNDDEELVQRISSRMICENKECQAAYNNKLMRKHNKQICEKCNSNLIKREDDTEEMARVRIAGFTQHNPKIISYYHHRDIPIKKISVSHATPEQVFEQFKNLNTLEKEEYQSQPSI